MYQASDQSVLKFIAQLMVAASSKALLVCECEKMVDFTYTLMFYKLLAGISDEELQKELLKKTKLSLADTEKMAVATESAYYS